MKEYTVIYEHGPDIWSAYVPDLPGCIATGKNRNDVETQIREAMQFPIEGLRQHGEPVPEPTIDAFHNANFICRTTLRSDSHAP